MISIKLNQDIAAQRQQVCEILLDHENLGRFFNAQFTLLTQEAVGEVKGGKGTVRQVVIGQHKFKEQIICANDEHIRYRIVGDGPVSKHQGDIYLSSVEPSVTSLRYEIQCKGPKLVPSFIVKYLIERDIRKALKKLARYFKSL